MKCSKCGNEFEGKFCPECGTAAAASSEPTTSNPPAPAPKKKSGCLKIGLIVLLIFVILGVIGSVFGEPSTSDSDNKANTSESSSVAVSESEPTYIEVTATDLLAAYSANTVSADNQYLDQMLKVTGTVGTIGKDILDQAYVTLTNDNDKYALISVQCYFAKDNLDDIANLKEGDLITITGTCTGSLANVTLENCDMVTE